MQPTQSVNIPEILYGVTYLASRYIRLHLDGRISYWSVVECIVIPTSVIWWLSVQHAPCLVMNNPTMISTDDVNLNWSAGLENKMEQIQLLLLWRDGLLIQNLSVNMFWAYYNVLSRSLCFFKFPTAWVFERLFSSVQNLKVVSISINLSFLIVHFFLD